MKHYKKMFLMEQFLRKVLSLFWFFLEVAHLVNLNWVLWTHLLGNAKSHTKIYKKLYCFWETRYLVWKIWNFDELEFENAEFENSCWNFVHIFYLPMFTKVCSGLIYSVKNSSYLPRSKKTWLLYTHRNHVHQ